MEKWLPFAVLVFLQLGDIISTRLACRTPGVLELNPLVRTIGLWPAKGLVVLLLLILTVNTKRPWKIWAVCGVYCVIIASNFRLAIQ